MIWFFIVMLFLSYCLWLATTYELAIGIANICRWKLCPMVFIFLTFSIYIIGFTYLLIWLLMHP
jgi:hypothetical protein